jgi:error-prone DNA polymerase
VLVNTQGPGGTARAGQGQGSIRHLPPDDPVVYKMLQQATIGLFQVESRAQMATLPRLADVLLRLVVQVAIIGRAPSSGRWCTLNRRAGREPVVYASRSSRFSHRTLGVPSSRSSCRMAMVAAGFTRPRTAPRDGVQAIGEADESDRNSSGKAWRETASRAQRPSNHHVDRLSRSTVPGIARGQLRAHRLAGASRRTTRRCSTRRCSTSRWVLSSGDAGEDAQRRGVHFAPIDVEVSDWDCTIEIDGRVRLGLRCRWPARPVGRAIAAAVLHLPAAVTLSEMWLRRRVDA